MCKAATCSIFAEVVTICPVSQTHLPSPSASWSACHLFKQPHSCPKLYGRESVAVLALGRLTLRYWLAQGWHPLNWALYDRVHCRCACCVFCCSKSALGAIGGSAAIYTLPQLQWLSSPSTFPFRKNRRQGDFEATQSFTRNCNSVLFLLFSFASCQLCRYLWKQPLNYAGVSPLKSCSLVKSTNIFIFAFFSLDSLGTKKKIPHRLKFWLDGRIIPLAQLAGSNRVALTTTQTQSLFCKGL